MTDGHSRFSQAAGFKLAACFLLFSLLLTSCRGRVYDICVYGTTPSGAVTAYAAARMGLRVAVVSDFAEESAAAWTVEPVDSSALNIGSKSEREYVRGLALKFYRTLGIGEGRLESWKVDPAAAEAVFEDWLRAPGITLLSVASSSKPSSACCPAALLRDKNGENVTETAPDALLRDKTGENVTETAPDAPLRDKTGKNVTETVRKTDMAKVKAKWYLDCRRGGVNISGSARQASPRTAAGKAGNVLRIAPDSMEEGQIAAMKVALALRTGLKSIGGVDSREIDSLMTADPYLDGMIPDAACWSPIDTIPAAAPVTDGESSGKNPPCGIHYRVVAPAYGRYDLFAFISDAVPAPIRDVDVEIPRKKKKLTLKAGSTERGDWHKLLNSTFERNDTVDIFVNPCGAEKGEGSVVETILLTPTANYEEDRVRPYVLEDPLRFSDGKRVRTKSDWTARRREILELFQSEMYGRVPEPCSFLLDSLEEGETAAGYGIRRQTRMWLGDTLSCGRSCPHIDWMVVRPKDGEGPFPCVLMLNFYGNHCLLPDKEILIPESWQDNDRKYSVTENRASAKARGIEARTDSRYQSAVGFLLARGYALVTACYSDVSPDPSSPELQDSLAFTGVFDLWGDRDPGRGDNTGALAAWAWALSRGIDLIGQTEGLDSSRILLTGCSRLAKAVLLAGAVDERAAVVAPIQTGAGGVPLAKRNFGENVRTETLAFPHWFCSNFFKYAGRESRLPFDQHLLLSCVAPRALFVGGFDNPWFDTRGEFLALKAASDVWEFLGADGIPDVEFPGDFDNSAIGTDVAYYHRNNEHGIAMADWVRMLDFADRAFAKNRR